MIERIDDLNYKKGDRVRLSALGISRGICRNTLPERKVGICKSVRMKYGTFYSSIHRDGLRAASSYAAEFWEKDHRLQTRIK